jgi:hypothetical protein
MFLNRAVCTVEQVACQLRRGRNTQHKVLSVVCVCVCVCVLYTCRMRLQLLKHLPRSAQQQTQVEPPSEPIYRLFACLVVVSHIATLNTAHTVSELLAAGLVWWVLN